MTVYQWKAGAHIRGSIQAQVAGEHLEGLRETFGLVTAPVVLEDAQSAASPLHPAFEWNDEAAAYEFRLNQARDILQSVKVLVRHEGHEEATLTRAFVVVQHGEGEGYTSIQVAMSNPDWRAQVVERARRELAQWRERYRELDELAKVFKAIDREVKAA